MKILFLDDRSKRIHSAIKKFANDDLTIVTNVKECLRFLSEEEWDVVYLDHDLGGEEFCDPDSPTCGMEIVRYIGKTEYPIKKKWPEFIIHSSNVFAATLMEDGLDELGFSVKRMRWEYD
jgi:hypothetical protein